jgi:hypothetical protein
VPRGVWIWLVLAVATTSCGGGGTLTEKSFRIQAETIQSLAAEGGLVAAGGAEGRTTETFVSVHTTYLQKEARKVESKLASASATGTLDEKRADAQRLAGQVAEELGELHRAPGDRALAARVQQMLEEDADAAEKLAQ